MRPLICALVVAVGSFMGCAETHHMRTTSSIDAGDGVVKTTDGDNGETKLTVKVKHLAPASQLAEDASVFVVWVQPDNSVNQSVGTLRVDENLNGTLQTLTPHKNFKVTVTPEPNGLVSAPTHAPVFTAQIERN